MTRQQDKPSPWQIEHSDIQWWTKEPQNCFTCGAKDRLILRIDNQLVCEQLGIPCNQEAIPTVAQHIKGNNKIPHWARSGYPMAYDHDSPPHTLFIPGPVSCHHSATIQPDSLITGDPHGVRIDGAVLQPDRSINLLNHSPTGFAWGYGGSGPSQLALALLLEAGASDQEALRLHQQFKRETIGILPDQTSFSLNGTHIVDWLNRQRTELPRWRP